VISASSCNHRLTLRIAEVRLYGTEPLDAFPDTQALSLSLSLMDFLPAHFLVAILWIEFAAVKFCLRPNALLMPNEQCRSSTKGKAYHITALCFHQLSVSLQPACLL